VTEEWKLKMLPSRGRRLTRAELLEQDPHPYLTNVNRLIRQIKAEAKSKSAKYVPSP